MIEFIVGVLFGAGITGGLVALVVAKPMRCTCYVCEHLSHD